ncbi:7531_t:CDS:10 [Funneliformis geosporum]|uniref:4564_t:CDS:1 n=1 Tax=Funneliformis geosporum TaxID=1117311 RepID=A0A9W4X0S7_9GLOM|nr:4564_t:CDS:10 [Funneliformis geosporum]CAI2186914.1 7531_t:CDS:10 [Funneliformis geosporum]
MSVPKLMDFYRHTTCLDWTCPNIVKYYRDNLERKDWDYVLDKIKKDLGNITASDSGFSDLHKRKAQEILDCWMRKLGLLVASDDLLGRRYLFECKLGLLVASDDLLGRHSYILILFDCYTNYIHFIKSWTANIRTKPDDTGFKIEIHQHQIEQQVLTTGNTVSIEKIDNHRNLAKKHCRDDEESTDERDITPLKQMKKSKTFDVSFDEYVNSAVDENVEELEDENDWQVGIINVTDRFRNYQKDILRKAERVGLDYENIYEPLALSSIMVLHCPCPYPKIFTNKEWAEITKSNPYTIKNSPLPQEISTSLHEAACKSFIGEDAFMNGGNTKLIYGSQSSFLIHYTDTMAYQWLHQNNGKNNGRRALLHISLSIDDITILNSEIKPLKCTPLQQKRDTVKAKLRARKSINLQLQRKGGPAEAGIFLNMGEWMESFFMDLKYDGLYRSWPFITTKLPVEKVSIPLAEFAISHVIALEERIGKLAEDYKYRDNQSNQKIEMVNPTPPTSFMRNFPNTPQVKLLLK